VAEFDTPKALLANPNSVFYAMVNETTGGATDSSSSSSNNNNNTATTDT
jgi:hypothetical protein